MTDMADAIITVDARFRIRHFNLGATDVFGYTENDIVGRPFTALFAERVRDERAAQLRAFVIAPETSLQMGARDELCALRRDGTEFLAEASLSKVAPAQTALFIVWLRNVTEPRRHEASQAFLAGIGSALGSSLDYLSTLARAARAAVPILGDTCIIDSYTADGGREITIADTDAEREDLARVMRAEFAPLYEAPALARERGIGRPYLIPVLDDAVLATLTVNDAHRRLVRRLHWRSVLFVPIVARDVTFGILTCCSRTRELEQHDLALATELAYRAALAIDNALLYRHAQQATRTRDELLGIVSHDLRSSLTTISLCAGALNDPVAPSVDGVRTMADAIRHATEHAQTMIVDLVDVTSIEAGSLALHRTDVHAAHVIARAYEAFVRQVESAGIALRHDCEDNLPPLRADEARLLQVLFNLLGNAVSHTAPGGTITLTAASDATRTAVVFRVEDTGRGIPETELPFLFDRFWQSHRSQRGGAGLGLAIAKGIVDSHGGRLTVASVPGEGSTFAFSIPCPAHRPQREGPHDQVRTR